MYSTVVGMCGLNNQWYVDTVCGNWPGQHRLTDVWSDETNRQSTGTAPVVNMFQFVDSVLDCISCRYHNTQTRCSVTSASSCWILLSKLPTDGHIGPIGDDMSSRNCTRTLCSQLHLFTMDTGLIINTIVFYVAQSYQQLWEYNVDFNTFYASSIQYMTSMYHVGRSNIRSKVGLLFRSFRSQQTFNFVLKSWEI